MCARIRETSPFDRSFGGRRFSLPWSFWGQPPKTRSQNIWNWCWGQDMMFQKKYLDMLFKQIHTDINIFVLFFMAFLLFHIFVSLTVLPQRKPGGNCILQQKKDLRRCNHRPAGALAGEAAIFSSADSHQLLLYIQISWSWSKSSSLG